jgi:hypothetical protein
MGQDHAGTDRMPGLGAHVRNQPLQFPADSVKFQVAPHQTASGCRVVLRRQHRYPKTKHQGQTFPFLARET